MDKKEKLLIEIVCIIVLSNFLCMFCFLFLNLAFQGNMEEMASVSDFMSCHQIAHIS